MCLWCVHGHSPGCPGLWVIKPNTSELSDNTLFKYRRRWLYSRMSSASSAGRHSVVYADEPGVSIIKVHVFNG